MTLWHSAKGVTKSQTKNELRTQPRDTNMSDQLQPEDPINPKHYTSHSSGIQCIEISKHLSGCLAQAFQYVWRCGQKDDPVQELKKAIWFIEAELTIDQKDKLTVMASDEVNNNLYNVCHYEGGNKYLALINIANANQLHKPRYTMLCKAMQAINAMISEYENAANKSV